jgi:hypothetical protein
MTRVLMLLLLAPVVYAGEELPVVITPPASNSAVRIRVNVEAGMAAIQTRAHVGQGGQRFVLKVKGAATNATLRLRINGFDAGTVTTDVRGNLRLNSLPEGVEPEKIELIEFAEPDGTNALTISF